MPRLNINPSTCSANATMLWQRWVLLHGLELTPEGAFRFRTLLVLCARQQGKTTLMQVLAPWRLYVDRAGLVSAPRRT